jgi:branched-chain amino acid transport system substrate-binding protein
VGALGQAMLKGVQLGAQTWNETYGGVTAGGKIYQVKTVVYNNNANPQEGVTNTQRLINQDKPAVIIGDFTSGVALAQLPIIEDAKWPWITNGSNPNLTGAQYKFANRVGANDVQNSIGWWAGLGDLMKKKGGTMKLAVLASKTDFSAARTASAKLNAPKNGFTIVVDETFDNTATDFYAIIDKVKAASPDLVYASGYANVGTFIKQANEKGLKAQFLIDDTFLPDLPTVLGAAGIGVWIDAAINPQGTEPIEKLYAKYAPPVIPGMTFNVDYALGWEGMMRACAALEKAGTVATDEASRIKIAQALRTVSFTGVLTFGTEDEVGNCIQNPRILQVISEKGGIKQIAANGKAI